VSERAFVTGGSGLLGGQVVRALCERGDAVVALARSDAAARTLREAGAEVARAALDDEAALAEAMRGCAVAYHLAGVNSLCPVDPAEMLRVNGAGPAIIVRAADRAGVPRVVHTSSAATIGEAHGTVGNEFSPHRGAFHSTYERSKLDGERAALAAGRDTGVEVVCVNPSSVQGPGRAGGTAKIWLAVLNGKLKVVVDTKVSLVDIADCTAGHLLVRDRGVAGERYLLNGATLSTQELIGIMHEVTGLDERPRSIPGAPLSALAAIVEVGARVARRPAPLCREMARTLRHGHRYDGSRATRELGLAYTPVRETVRRTLVWALAEGLIKRPLPRLA
jgi:dihydroflavonol-4-reductase